MLSYTARNLDKNPSKTVLFLHAFPLSAEMWSAQMEAVAKAGYGALAPNVYGIDGSPERDSWNFLGYVTDVSILLSSLNLQSVTVVGLSMGSYQAYTMYKHFPQRVTSLVLCDTRAEADTEAGREARYEFIDALMKKGNDEAVSRMVPKFFAERTYTEKPELIERISALIRVQKPEAIAAQLMALASRDDSTMMLKSIACPTTILVGDEDKITPPSIAADIQARISKSELHLLKACGHLPNLEEPEAFNQLLLNHLDRVYQHD
ncbi:MAG: alpha/beta fold hydrolase [Chlorobiales bacterium]|nr:alpha/beta fold hydrolase [Chlorobiales bacterium]